MARDSVAQDFSEEVTPKVRPEWQGAPHAGAEGRSCPDRRSIKFKTPRRARAWQPRGTEEEGDDSRMSRERVLVLIFFSVEVIQ